MVAMSAADHNTTTSHGAAVDENDIAMTARQNIILLTVGGMSGAICPKAMVDSCITPSNPMPTDV